MTTASIHDIIMNFPIIDATRDHEYILMDADYDLASIHDYVFEKTNAIPVIDTNI